MSVKLIQLQNVLSKSNSAKMISSDIALVQKWYHLWILSRPSCRYFNFVRLTLNKTSNMRSNIYSYIIKGLSHWYRRILSLVGISTDALKLSKLGTIFADISAITLYYFMYWSYFAKILRILKCWTMIIFSRQLLEKWHAIENIHIHCKNPFLLRNRSIMHRFFRLQKASFTIPTHKP